MNPRIAVGIGISFVVVSIAYYVFPVVFGGHVDWAGVVMLIALAAAMSILFYVLLAGSPRDPGEASGPGGHGAAAGTSGATGHASSTGSAGRGASH